MATLSKGCKQDNFEPHQSLKCSFTNIWGLHLNFVECEFLLESNSPDILALYETNLDDSIDSGNFSVRGYLPLIWKESVDSYAWSCSLCDRRISFYMGLISWNLNILHSVSYFFVLYQPLSLLCTVFDSISSNIDEILSIDPSANVFVFEDFNVHHQDWLTSSFGTNRHGNYVIIFPSQMILLRWLTFLLGSLTVTRTDLLFWIYFFVLTVVFVLQWLTFHWEILIMLLSQFPLTFQ